MSNTDRAIAFADLAIETFLALSLTPFMGPAAWRSYPGSPYARALLDEWGDSIDHIQGN